MSRFLFDTAVFVYARGRDHPYREPCRRLVVAARDGLISGEASIELVQEYAHLLRRRGMDGPAVREEARAVAALCVLHAFGTSELRIALNLVASVAGLGVRDAVHAATAFHLGIPMIVSPDRSFDGVAGLQRVTPEEAVRRLVPSPRSEPQPD